MHISYQITNREESLHPLLRSENSAECRVSLIFVQLWNFLLFVHEHAYICAPPIEHEQLLQQYKPPIPVRMNWKTLIHEVESDYDSLR